MRKPAAFAILGPVVAILTACGSDRAGETIDKAEGEILMRSVTDDMIPYETLRSQPPLADPDKVDKSNGPAPAIADEPQAGSAELDRDSAPAP